VLLVLAVLLLIVGIILLLTAKQKTKNQTAIPEKGNDSQTYPEFEQSAPLTTETNDPFADI
jgi:competence protein ComGC